MAKAELVTAEPTVQLTLSKPEAQALADILSKIGGSAKDTRRGLADNIANALRTVDIYYNYELTKVREELTGSLYFKVVE